MRPECLAGEAEELPEPRSRPHGHGIWRTLGALGAVGIVAAALVETVVARHPPASLPAPGAPVAQPSYVVRAVVPDDRPATAPVVTQLGRRLLGATSGWELFGLGWGVVVRIQPARGIVTVTPAPGQVGQGGIAFVAGPAAAIVRPDDALNGYEVPDGGATRPLSGVLATSVNVLPGPTPAQAWVVPEDSAGAVHTPELVDLRSGRVRPTGLRVPAGLAPPITPDGSGYLLYNGLGGVYDVRPGAVRRVTTGTVLAVGAHSWLALECDAGYRCSDVLVDQRTGLHRKVGSSPQLSDSLRGAISPDGRFAAYLADVGLRTESVRLVDLTAGRDRALAVRPAVALFGSTPFAWIPDGGHRLLMADNEQQITVADPATGAAQRLGIALPNVMQLAVRAA